MKIAASLPGSRSKGEERIRDAPGRHENRRRPAVTPVGLRCGNMPFSRKGRCAPENGINLGSRVDFGATRI